MYLLTSSISFSLNPIPTCCWRDSSMFCMERRKGRLGLRLKEKS
jgi:hypothetical protein